MNNKAFTLIELVVWITISMMLMVSVGIFVNNWMANILTQQKVIENTTKLTDFTSNLHTAINLMQSWSIFPVKTASWIIFKRNKNLWEWGFSYIWTTISNIDWNWDWIYCESGSENVITKHILLKHFIPFEEHNSDSTNEDIFDNYDNILKSKLIWWYQSFQKENIIKKSWNIIIWKWIFWNKFEEWDSWKNIYLNSPTWLAMYWSNILFISDTLNNRVLYYKVTEDEIYTLLNENDWLNEPTGLYYNDSEKALYIANSWNWEILKYSSKSETNKEINIDLNLDKDIHNIKKIELEFYPWITDITDPNQTSDINFHWILTTSTDYFTWTENKINYWFSNFNNNYSTTNNQPCTSSYTKYYEESNDIIKEEITSCPTWTWTIKKYKTSQAINKNKWDNIKITTNSDVIWTDYNNNWAYYIKLNIVWDSIYTRYFSHFIKSDDDILTTNDNILEVINSWLNYPTWLWWDSWNNKIAYNKFWYSWRNFSNKTIDNNLNDIVLQLPISYLNIEKNNWLVTFLLKYYKKYNCYNLDDKTERTYLFKKNLE
jgi:hypothetical protein